jgi:hypothetical protein
MADDRQFEQLTVRVKFLLTHTRIELSKLNVNSVFKIGGLNLTQEYIIIKKGTKYAYFQLADDPFAHPEDLCKKRLDYEVYIPK